MFRASGTCTTRTSSKNWSDCTNLRREPNRETCLRDLFAPVHTSGSPFPKTVSSNARIKRVASPFCRVWGWVAPRANRAINARCALSSSLAGECQDVTADSLRVLGLVAIIWASRAMSARCALSSLAGHSQLHRSTFRQSAGFRGLVATWATGP